MSQEQMQPQRRAGDQHLEHEVARQQQPAQDASFDDLLDQIDAVIERNPEGYVRSFVQRGGQ